MEGIKKLKPIKLTLNTLLYIIAFTAGLFSCKTSIQHSTKNSALSIDSNSSIHTEATNLINPYKEALDAEMNEILVVSSQEFPKERGKSETKLGNLVSDLSLNIAQSIYTDSIDFCLLNFGGLRTSLPKGEITRGKIFELMPFENKLVVITVSFDKYEEFISYIKNVGGQPISGISINYKTDSKSSLPKKLSYKILTSDYLASGGDKMNFLLNPIKTEDVGIKLRDAIIQFCVQEHKKGNQLSSKIDGRITFE